MTKILSYFQSETLLLQGHVGVQMNYRDQCKGERDFGFFLGQEADWAREKLLEPCILARLAIRERLASPTVHSGSMGVTLGH
jgi:hypothetical protein